MPIDQALLRLLVPLAIALLISGLDDLLIDVTWFFSWLQSKLRPAASLFPPGPLQLDSAPRRRIAILLPLWQEHDVIARMIEHNVAAIRYSDYHIFAGAYPNDDRTQEAVSEVTRRFANVHLVLCPHDGPTSKADCLNWIFQHIALYEETNSLRFDVLLTHDAEDLIHPDELHWINYYAGRYDFIQTPVLPLATPLSAVIHGIYCDEFAEYHTIDMPVRPLLGGFLPSAGVGTGYRRDALERLAESAANRVFETDALTEDYQNGLRMFRLGCSQAIVPLSRCAGHLNFLATREFFPQNWRAARRQRTRWVMGIALQGWERFGWGANPGEVYWLWRDRKGLIANPLTLVANLMFVYGLATGMWLRVPQAASRAAMLTMGIAALRLAVRMACSERIYGPVFAVGVPVRALCANVLNAAATVQAIGKYATARAKGLSLVWVKTDHAFPNRAALLADKRKLGEILVGSAYLTAAALSSALPQPAGIRLGEHLVRLGLLDEDSVYQALSLQQGLPFGDVDPVAVTPAVARAMPEHVVRQWSVLPFRVDDGGIHVATSDVPSAQLTTTLRPFTALEIRFHLMKPRAFEKLTEALL